MSRKMLAITMVLALLQLVALAVGIRVAEEHELQTLKYTALIGHYSATVNAVRAVEGGAADIVKSYGFTNVAELKEHETTLRDNLQARSDELYASARKVEVFEISALALILLLPATMLAMGGWRFLRPNPVAAAAQPESTPA